MDIKKHSSPSNLEKYSFVWSEARLVVAAVALFIGGVPPVWYLVASVPALFGIVSAGLTLAWLISGAASIYLLYRWNANKRMLFGGKAPLDTAAFFVAVISGINLGFAGLSGRNIGISIFPIYPLFIIVALAYLASAFYLFNRWKASGRKIF